MSQNDGENQKSRKAHENAGNLLYKVVGVDAGGHGEAYGAQKKHCAFGDYAKALKKPCGRKIYPLSGNKQPEAQGNVHVKLGRKTKADLPAHNQLKKRQHQKQQRSRRLAFGGGNGFRRRTEFYRMPAYLKAVSLKNFRCFFNLFAV